MASTDDLYLPNLSKIFLLEQSVVSWQDVYNDLTDSANDDRIKRAIDFLSNTTPKDILTRNRQVVGGSDSTSKSLFDAKTAAINIPPGGPSNVDIEQIKADTLWLSADLKAPETAALRSTLLEWQFRPQCQLQSGYSEAESASLEDVNGYKAAGLRRTASVSDQRSDDDFNTDTARRRRQVQIHFQEIIYLTKTWLVLIQALSNQENGSVRTFAQSLAEGSLDYHSHVAVLIQASEELLTGPSWSVIDIGTEEVWYAGQICRIQELMDVVIACAAMKTDLSAARIMHWFQIMDKTDFFSNVLATRYVTLPQIQNFQTSVILTSIALLDPLLIISNPSLPSDQTWARDVEVLSTIYSIIARAVEEDITHVLPLAWTLSLMLKDVQTRAAEARHKREEPHIQKAIDQSATLDTATGRRGSLSASLQQSIWEDMVDVICSVVPDVADPVQALYFVSSDRDAVDIFAQMIYTIQKFSTAFVCHVYRRVVQETLILATELLGYCSEVLELQLSLLDSKAIAMLHNRPISDDPSTVFAHNEYLMGQIFATAAGRFPHDALPFLRLCRCLATSDHFSENGTHHITFLLQNLDSFTHIAVDQFAQYRTIREDENLNLVALNQSIQPLALAHAKSIAHGRSAHASLVLPANTPGTMISEGEPPIIRWELSFSGLALIGKWLDLHYQHQLQALLCEEELASDVAAEAILLLSNLLENTNSSLNKQVTEDERHTAVKAILDDVSSFYSPNSDFISRIFDVFEQELQAFRQRPQSTFDTSLTHACVYFLQVLLRIRPTHFWASVGRTSAIDANGGSSLLYALIAGTEPYTGDYKLTQSLTALYADIIEAALQRPLSLAKSSLVTPLSNLLNNANKQYEHVLQGFTVNMLDIYDALITWNSPVSTHLNAIVASLSRSFERILILRHGFGDTSTPTTLNSCYELTAESIMTRLRPFSDRDSKSGAIVQHLLLETPRYVEPFLSRNSDALTTILDLTATIIRCGQALNLPAAGFETTLLCLTPVIVRQIPQHKSSESATCLLSLLLKVLDSITPISLLGYLGSQSAVLLLNVLSSQQALAEPNVQIATWALLTQLLSQHQQWLAIVMLTGRTPEKLHQTSGNEKPAYRGKLLFDTALDNLSLISKLDSAVATSVLQFVIRAQQNWSWTIESATKRKEGITALVAYVSSFSAMPASEPILRALSRIVDLWSTRLHFTKATHDVTSLTLFHPLLEWLSKHAIKAASYNTSLHSNLHKNFMAKFGLSLSNFRRRPLEETDRKFFNYDLEFADFVLGGKPYWTANGRHADQSYSAEMQRANANLGMINGEAELLHSFRNLCIEHAGYLGQNEQLRLTMAHVISNCLNANKAFYPSEIRFENMTLSRAEMSLALVQQLALKQEKSGVNFRNLLSTAWECAISAHSSYEAAISSNQLYYWRVLLSIVLISLKFHRQTDASIQNSKSTSHTSPKSASASELMRRSELSVSVILEIMTVVVGDGLGTVVSLLQEAKQAELRHQKVDAPPEVSGIDVALIVRMLETILSLGRASEVTAQLSERLLASGGIRSATQLYAYAHLLIDGEMGNDPIYAEPAMKLLRLMSTLPILAEEMAVEGVLSRVLTARVTQIMQKMPDGVSNIDKRPHCQLLYRIWAEGILPLSLNLLHGVRGPIAAEISSFLNRFPLQLSRANKVFAPKAGNFVTLGLAEEAATLALVSFILDTYRSAGPSAGVDPTSVLPLVGYDEHRKALAQDISEFAGMTKEALKAKIVPTNEKEILWYKDDTLTDKVLTQLKSASLCLRSDEDMSGQL